MMKAKHLALSLLMLSLLATTLMATVRRAIVPVENDRIRLNFDIDNDLRLLSVEDVQTGAIFEFHDKPLWKIFVRDVVSGSQLAINSDTHAYTFGHTLTNHGTYKELVATWSDITVNATNKLDFVTVKVTLHDGEVLADMKIVVRTDTPDYSLFKAFCPDFHLKPIGGAGADDLLTYPQHGGYIIHDPINKMSPLGWIHPGYWGYQFFTYNDDSGLLYMGTDDTESYIKVMAMVGIPAMNELYWRLENYPDDHVVADVDYSQPYNFKIGAVQGDWYDAAMLYREWALGRIVFRKPMNHPDSDFPKSLLDIDGIGAYGLGNSAYGLTPVVLQGMKDSKNFYGVDKMVLHLYLWTNEPGTATSWPDVTPVPNVKPGLVELKNEGDIALAYVQMAYDSDLPSYVTKNIEYWASKNIDGSVYVSQGLVRPDPYTPFWQDFSRDWTKSLVEDVGFDGAYWDFWSGSNVSDYDANHGHALGGGNYHMQGKYTQLSKTMDEVHTIPGKEEWFATSEYLVENFVDLMPIEMWNEDIWDESAGGHPEIRVPIYEAIYGDRQHMWTVTQTYPINDPGLDNFYSYKNASKLSIGCLLGFNGDPVEPFDPGVSMYGQPSFQLLGKLMRMTERARKYILWGQIKRNVQVNTVGSMNYYTLANTAPPVDGRNQHWIYTSTYPEVSYIIPSVWGYTDEAGYESLAVMLINWFESQQSIDYTFAFDDYGLTKGRRYEIKELTETGIQHVGVVSDDFTRMDTLDARSIRIYMVDAMVMPRQIGGIAK